MTVGDMCQRNVTVVPRGESIIDAAKRMRTHHVGDVIVVEEQNGSRIPAGILTDRDIVLGIVASNADHLPYLTVDDAMSDEIVTAREDLGTAEALALMKTHGVRRLPIVNAAGALVGIVTTDDLLRLLARDLETLVQVITKQQERERRYRV